MKTKWTEAYNFLRFWGTVIWAMFCFGIIGLVILSMVERGV